MLLRSSITRLMLGLALGAAPLAAHDDPIPTVIGKADVRIQLQPVVGVYTAPVSAVVPKVESLAQHLFVVDQVGILWAIDQEAGTQTLFLDVRQRLVPLGIAGPYTSDSRGLLGLAFHPRYEANGLLYTYTSEPRRGRVDFSTMPAGIDADHQSVLTEWQVTKPGLAPDITRFNTLVNPRSARVLMRIDQPQASHNGGALAFGPDEYLYISLGDGGLPDDEGPGHSPGGNAQDVSNVLGTVLRIDTRAGSSANGRYGIPDSNPFIGRDNAVPEIWAYGFRNPWRMSFDMDSPSHAGSGDLWLGDVGERAIEEINRVVRGGNHGWPIKEGRFWFDQAGPALGGLVDDPPIPPPGHLVDPVAQYDHDEGRAVIGGHVYRGSAIPALQGQYVFGEWARTFSADSRLLTLHPEDPSKPISEFEILNLPDGLTLFLLGFGRDAAGELYVMGNVTGTPFITPTGLYSGFVLKIVPQLSPWLSMGQGLSGSSQLPPRLTGVGEMTPRSQNRLELSGALPNTSTLLVVGLDDENLPFAGGVLVPHPLVVIDLPPTNADGADVMPFTWASDAPAGTLFYTQWWIEDDLAELGWAASNALQVTAQ